MQVESQPHKLLAMIPDLAKEIILLLGFDCYFFNNLSAKGFTEALAIKHTLPD